MIKRMLATEGKVGRMITKKRIVMTAMPTGLVTEDGTPSDDLIAFYLERARGGAGIIIAEAVYVGDVKGCLPQHRQLSLRQDSNMANWAKLVVVVHKFASKLFIQLQHPGLTIGELKVDAIKRLEQYYIEAAARAAAASCDGIELDGAAGSLLQEFMSPLSNQRQDEYGGSFENRMRFVKDIVSAIRKKAGEDYPLTIRLTLDEQGASAGIKLARYLEQEGIAAINYSCVSDKETSSLEEPLSCEHADLLRTIKKEIGIPVMAENLICTPEAAEQLLQTQTLDFIGVGRGFLADENWGLKACDARDVAVRKCICCLECFNTVSAGGRIKCNVNPRAGCENQYNTLKQNGEGRIVAIAGAGPAGLAAAETLIKRGFHPVLLEKKGEVGGQAIIGKYVSEKERLYRVVEYYEGCIGSLGIDVRLNCEATPELLKELQPVAVLVATGAVPVVPASVKGTELSNVYSVDDILRRRVNFAQNHIAVIGAGLTGLDIAEKLAAQGNKVAVVDMQQLDGVTERLGVNAIGYYPLHLLQEITEEAVILRDLASQQLVVIKADAVVLALGYRPYCELADQLQGLSANIQVIGNAHEVANVGSAVHAGYRAAYSL